MFQPMSRAASLTTQQTNLPAGFLDMEALRAASVQRDPFPFFIVPRFVKAEALEAIRVDYPVVPLPGSFPLSTLQYGQGFTSFMEQIQRAEMTKTVGEKLGMDLSASPTMVTVRGQSREKDGKIHIDSRTKLVTALIYMNDAWESPKGRLRLVRSQTDLNDVIAEVPPDQGTLLVFRNDTNAWHGFEPFAGPRRVIQLNWVTDASVVRREQTRHRVSAFFKRLRKLGG